MKKKYYDIHARKPTNFSRGSMSIKENIIFPEYMAYHVFKLKMLSHMLEDEYFDFKNKNWKKRHE